MSYVSELGAMTDGDPLDRLESSAGAVVLEQREDAALLHVTGALDLALAPRLRQMIERAVRLRPALLIVDLTDLGFLASAGMAVLLFAHRQCSATTQVRIVASGRLVLRPLELTRLTDELAIFPTVTKALTAP